MLTDPPVRAANGERILRFPTGDAIGSILVRRVDAHPDSTWEALATARWSVLVPAGMDVRLWVTREGATRGLAALDDLPADALFELVLLGCPTGDDDIDHVRGLTGLRCLDLFCTRVTDESVGVVADLPSLEWLSFTATRITDRGVEQLVTLDRLSRLSLKRTQVTDRSMLALAMLPELKWLSLTGTSITDAGLEALADAPSLETLSITGTNVTAAGRAAWSRQRPDVTLVEH